MASDDPNYNSLHQSKGRVEMMGPIDYSTNYVCGLLIDGFQFPPTILTAHNPPYYARLIESCGFTKAKDWYAWWFSEYPAPAERLRKIALARAGKLGIKIRPIKRWAQPDIRHIAFTAAPCTAKPSRPQNTIGGSYDKKPRFGYGSRHRPDQRAEVGVGEARVAATADRAVYRIL
jgi:hypothetical protein